MEKLLNSGLVFLILSQTSNIESHLPGLHSLNSKISMLSYYQNSCVPDFWQSVFLYNSELWTLTKTLEKDINVIQRHLLRSILNIYYPKVISNKDFYEKTKTIPWKVVVKRRRLSWTGHLFRLDPRTSSKVAIQIYSEPSKKTQGGLKKTWINNVTKELNIHIDLNNPDTYRLANNRKQWRELIYIAINIAKMEIIL